jgi:hypothetical protein
MTANSLQFSNAADLNSRIHTEHPDSRSQTTSVLFHGPFVPNWGTFSPAALPRNPKLERKRCSRACIPCRTKKAKCNGSKPICGRCHDYELQCSFLEDQHEQKSAEDREELTREYIEKLEQRVSELEAQMAALQQITAQAYCTSPCILHSAPRPGR